MLYEIVHDNKSKLWCGPAAIAAVTGQPTSEIHARLRRITGRAIKGLHNTELLAGLTSLGVNHSQVWRRAHGNKPPTLAAWLHEHRELFADRPVIISLTSHYVVVEGRRFIDNYTKGTVALGAAPHRRSRVKHAWVVFQ